MIVEAILQQSDFDTERYHPPLDRSKAMGRCIFAHIANLPGPGGTAAIGDDALGYAKRALPAAGLSDRMTVL
jgi:hypothetical protein